MLAILSAAFDFATAGEPMGWIVLILLGGVPAVFTLSGAVMVLNALCGRA